MKKENKAKINKESGKLLTVEEQILDPVKTMARRVFSKERNITPPHKGISKYEEDKNKSKRA